MTGTVIINVTDVNDLSITSISVATTDGFGSTSGNNTVVLMGNNIGRIDLTDGQGILGLLGSNSIAPLVTTQQVEECKYNYNSCSAGYCTDRIRKDGQIDKGGSSFSGPLSNVMKECDADPQCVAVDYRSDIGYGQKCASITSGGSCCTYVMCEKNAASKRDCTTKTVKKTNTGGFPCHICGKTYKTVVTLGRHKCKKSLIFQ